MKEILLYFADYLTSKRGIVEGAQRPGFIDVSLIRYQVEDVVIGPFYFEIYMN